MERKRMWGGGECSLKVDLVFEEESRIWARGDLSLGTVPWILQLKKDQICP